MVLKDILAISGEPGLFKFIAQGKNAIIVEHLETKKRSSVYGSAKVSSLEDIAIFTDKEDMPLAKVFDLIHEKENGGTTVDPKSDHSDLVKWFEDIVPDYSRGKVYTSDIKKVALWYNILHKLGLLIKEEEKKDKEETEIQKLTETKEKKAARAKDKTEKKTPAEKKKVKSKPRPKAT